MSMLAVVGGLLIAAGVCAAWILGGLESVPRALLAVGGLAVLVWAVSDREALTRGIRSPAVARDGFALLVVALAVVTSVWAFSLSRTYEQTWDLSTHREFALSGQSLSICDGMGETVKAQFFVGPSSPLRLPMRDLSRALETSCPQVEVERIDPAASPRAARAAGVVTDQGVIVLTKDEGQARQIEGQASQARFFRELVVLIAKAQHEICWAVDHGEADPDDALDPGAYGQVVFSLDDFNYNVSRLSVGTQGVPDRCAALVVARPQIDWQQVEVDAMDRYLRGGGRVAMMLDIVEDDKSPRLTKALRSYGVRVGVDLVVDMNPKNRLLGVDDPAFVVLSEEDLSAHSITRGLPATVVLGVSRSVTPLDESAGAHVELLLRTGPDAWAETDLDPANTVEPGPDEPMGGIGVMVAVEGIGRDAEQPAALSGGKMVVVGDADFASNALLKLGNNGDLFLNTVAWLVEEQTQLGERERSSEHVELTTATGALIAAVALVGVPGVGFFMAWWVWMRRRAG
jgi:ABC-type uncharacterized transport system involved in gliding motility auxiliary subunit